MCNKQKICVQASKIFNIEILNIHTFSDETYWSKKRRRRIISKAIQILFSSILQLQVERKGKERRRKKNTRKPQVLVLLTPLMNSLYTSIVVCMLKILSKSPAEAYGFKMEIVCQTRRTYGCNLMPHLLRPACKNSNVFSFVLKQNSCKESHC